ncbi:MAG: hypothetical protein NZ823_07820 [Blastocatellia bacterium]|nr:hypothetical protein [Blastocatellia bacterium]
MASDSETGTMRHGSHWRITAWAVAVLLLLLPLVAMQLSDEVNWSATDFAFAGALLIGALLTYELVARTAANTAYRVAFSVALAAAVCLVWLSLGVGIIGRDGDPANLIYFGVLGVGVIGALLTRFQADGMTRVLLAMALAQTLITAIALIAGLGQPWSGPLELICLNGFFVALWVGSAWLFRHAARRQTEQGLA